VVRYLPKVILIKGESEDFAKGKDMGKVFMALRKFGFDNFRRKRVLVKLHMGERGNGTNSMSNQNS